jgi:hypothetical protein
LRSRSQNNIFFARVCRSYFRCTHKSDQGCNAKRHVQLCEADPSKHVVTYYGEHTCRDPSKTHPLVIHAAAGASNLLSFGTSNRASAGSISGASSSQVVEMDRSAPQLSTSWCTNDDMFSSSPGSFIQVDELGAVVVSAAAGVTSARAVPGSAPDNGDNDMMMPGPGGGPTSPRSLGYEVGDDDDFFLLDP